MSKRPPQRQATAAAAGIDDRVAAAVPYPAMPLHAEPAQAAQASPEPRALSLAGNREDFLALLSDLRGQGDLDVADEAAILREYDGLLVELREEKRRLEREYRERIAREGVEPSNDWLAATAEALGGRHGEQMRRLMATIPTFAENVGA